MDLATKKYLFFGLIVVVLFFVLITLSKIEQPLLELAKLPKCGNNDVVVTTDLRSNVIKFANDYIRTGTGESYFGNHYHFLNLEYSAVDCVFVVKYDFTYDEFHEPMSMSISVFSENSMEVIETKAFLRPIGILVTSEEAVALANKNVIPYDYYNLEADLSYQTFVYRFYKDSLTEGLVVVFEVDAQSKEIKKVTIIPESNPIV
jgi:hypothetical protein